MPLLRRLLTATLESKEGGVLFGAPPARRGTAMAAPLVTPAVPRPRARGKFLFGRRLVASVLERALDAGGRVR